MTDEERDAWALFRYRLISPLLDAVGLPTARRDYLEFLQMHPPIAPTGQPLRLSMRTLRRYQAQYQRHGFEGLRPHRRVDWGTLRAIPATVWDQAQAFKREVPERSADQVLALLEAWAPTVGLPLAVIHQVRRATLYRQWARHGLTRHQLHGAAPKRFRRWEAQAPGHLWQTDVMNGPYLPDPTATQPDRKRATYCLVILDDYSRRVVAGRFAWHADSALLEQLLWEAIQRWGAPQRLYTDQGAIYTSDRLGVLCGRLNIRLVHTPPYTPQGKGKQERWWGHLQSSFLPELRAYPADSLGQLNTWFQAWCQEHYHRRIHSETGDTPVERWGQGGVHRLLDGETLRQAFRIEIPRKVDKTGQIRWQGQRWVVPEGLLQIAVQLRLAPEQPDVVEVWVDDHYYGRAVPADQVSDLVGATATPAVVPAPPTGLSYLQVLADQQRGHRPEGIPYFTAEQEDPS